MSTLSASSPSLLSPLFLPFPPYAASLLSPLAAGFLSRFFLFFLSVSLTCLAKPTGHRCSKPLYLTHSCVMALLHSCRTSADLSVYRATFASRDLRLLLLLLSLLTVLWFLLLLSSRQSSDSPSDYLSTYLAYTTWTLVRGTLYCSQFKNSPSFIEILPL